MTDGPDGFGRYLASVAERDIDLLLMEEFHVSEDFVDWFSSRVSEPNVRFEGAWHSVSDTDGETDLLMRVRCREERVGILIENKIAAPEQNLQGERYHLRGIRSREAGKFDRYITVMCAPSRYLAGLGKESVYQHQVSYEDICDWFGRKSDPRSNWRQAVLAEAIEQGRRGYSLVINETNSMFHAHYWEHLSRTRPQLRMARPGAKGSKSTWIIMKGSDFPKSVQLHHKLDQATIELGFSGLTVNQLKAQFSELPTKVRVIQKGKTASLVVHVQPIDMKLGFSAQRGAVDAALDVAEELAPLAIKIAPL